MAVQLKVLPPCDIAVGGVVECMSRAGYTSTSQRWESRMGDSTMVDMMVGALTDPFEGVHMSILALLTKCIGGGQGIAAAFERM